MICTSLSALTFAVICLVAGKFLRRDKYHMMVPEFKERYDKLPDPIKPIAKPDASKAHNGMP